MAEALCMKCNIDVDSNNFPDLQQGHSWSESEICLQSTAYAVIRVPSVPNE